MTVQDLINELQRCDLEQEVVFAYNSQDYWRTDVAQVVGRVREGEVTYSKYHDMYTPIDVNEYNERESEDEPSEEDHNEVPVVIITGKGKLYR